MLHEDDIIAQFREAMRAGGIPVSADMFADGEFHRVHVDGDPKGSKNGFYVLHFDDRPAGSYGCNKRFGNDAKFSWSAKNSKPLTPEEKRAFKQRMDKQRAEKAERDRERRETAAMNAQETWDSGIDCDDDQHPYLKRKGIKSHGLRVGTWQLVDNETGEVRLISENALLIPIRDAKKKIHSLQAIFPSKLLGDRDKDYLKDGAKEGLFFSMGKPLTIDVGGVPRAVIMIGEGYATLASAHECSGHAAIVAFDAANLLPTAKAMRARFPDAVILMLADNDQWTLTPVVNPGLVRAREAAKAVDGLVALPPFTAADGTTAADGRTKGPTDFNDLHMLRGADLVRQVITDALNPPAPDLLPWDEDPDAVDEGPAPVPVGGGGDDVDDDDDQGPAKNGHFAILGYNRGIYYIFQHGKRQIDEITKSNISEIGLIEIAPLNWWEANFPGERSKIDTKAAAQFIFRTAERKGIYDPSRVRGRGAWIDQGRMIYHHGDYLSVDGEPTDVTEIRSRYVYELDRSMPPPTDEMMSDADGQFLLELSQMFRWSKPGSALLLAGWVALAPVCGALSWRPHCWINGGAGTGKTTVLKDYVHHMLGDLALFANGNSSEAGIRQELQADARPVLFDESESNEESDARRIQSVLSLIRQASTESQALTLKGTAGGSALRYHIRSMFCLASIQVALKQQADVERLSVLTLRPKREDADPAATWELMSEKLYRLKRDADIPGRMFRRSMTLLPVTLKNIHVFAKAAAQIFGSQRDGDQYGTLIAGAWSLISQELVTEAQAKAMIQKYDWSEHRDKGDTDEAERAMSSLMGAKIRMSGGVEVTVYELVKAAFGDPTENVDLNASKANALLQRHGMKVRDDRLLMSNNSDALGELMRHTTFSADYRGVLLRVEGADRNENKPVKFNGVQSKCISIPLGPLVLDGDAPAF